AMLDADDNEMCSRAIDEDIVVNVTEIELSTNEIIVERCMDESENVFFDLDEILEDYIIVEPNYSIVYYETEQAAIDENEELEIDNPDEFIVEFGQISEVWVRVSTDGGCYDFINISFDITPLPELLTFEAELYECGFEDAAIFDLEEALSDLVDNADDYTFTYHNEESDAEAGENALEDYSDYEGFDGEVIFVRVETQDECVLIAEITLRIIDSPEVEDLEDYAL